MRPKGTYEASNKKMKFTISIEVIIKGMGVITGSAEIIANLTQY